MIGEIDKKQKSVIAIYGIIMIVYIIAFMVVPLEKDGVAWTTFVFTVLSIIGSLVINGYAFNCKNSKDVVYGFPIFRIGIIYMLVQFCSGLAMYIVNTFISIPLWIALLCSVLILGVAVVCTILAINTRDVVVKVEKDNENIKQISLFSVCISGIVDLCKNEDVKKELEELETFVKYSSDPVSNEHTKGIETEIEDKLKELKENIDSEGVDLLPMIQSIKQLLNERNRICQMTK